MAEVKDTETRWTSARSGELLFRHPHETRFGANVNTPIFHGGLGFITSGYGCGSKMFKLRVDLCVENRTSLRAAPSPRRRAAAGEVRGRMSRTDSKGDLPSRRRMQ